MRWFGESWGAPLCIPSEQGKTPLGKRCLRCTEAFTEHSQGVSMLEFKQLPEPHWQLECLHLKCFIEWVVPAPRRTDVPAETVNLTGALLPWDDESDQPYMLDIPHEGVSVPVFSSKEKLEEAVRDGLASYDRIKFIEDGAEFLRSIPGGVGIVKDPRLTAEGRTRYQRVVRD